MDPDKIKVNVMQEFATANLAAEIFKLSQKQHNHNFRLQLFYLRQQRRNVLETAPLGTLVFKKVGRKCW